MENDYVMIGKAAKEKLIEGVRLITDAISQTYGPNGTNVIIKNLYGVRLTKDGKTVAESVKSNDPYVLAGIDIIKEVSKQTADTVGDGSSSVAILTRVLIEQYKDEKNPIELSRKLREECDKVIDFLKENKKEITSKEDIAKVATLSANNDSLIGNVIAEAFDHVGKNGIVKFEQGEGYQDEVKYSQGFRIDNGMFSPMLINTPQGDCVLENCVVYISQTKMEEVKEVNEIASKIFVENKHLPEDKKKSLLLMAPNFDSEITMYFRTNMFLPNGNFKFKAGMVISPEFGARREQSVEDIKIILGDTMTCDKVILTNDDTTFIGYHPDKEKFDKRVLEIQESLKGNLSELDLDYYQKRLANFVAGMATIYVGGYSETEVKSRMDLYEDAICATYKALEEGVLPGGGLAFNQYVNNFKDSILAKTLKTPGEILDRSAAISKPAISILSDDVFWMGTDYKTGKFGDLYLLGVIEPFSVVKATLENAVSSASNILTCNCVILND